MRTVTSLSMVRLFQRSRSRATVHANACAFRNPPKGASGEQRERWADRWLAFHNSALHKDGDSSVLERLEHAVAWARQCDQDYIGDSTIRTDDLDIAVALMRRVLEAEREISDALFNEAASLEDFGNEATVLTQRVLTASVHRLRAYATTLHNGAAMSSRERSKRPQALPSGVPTPAPTDDSDLLDWLTREMENTKAVCSLDWDDDGLNFALTDYSGDSKHRIGIGRTVREALQAARKRALDGVPTPAPQEANDG